MTGPLRYSLLGSTFLPLDALFNDLFVLALPTPEANLWDRRFASESIMVFWFVVNAKESTASDKDGLPCSSEQIDYDLWVLLHTANGLSCAVLR